MDFPLVCFGVVALIIAGIGGCVNVAVGRLYVFFWLFAWEPSGIWWIVYGFVVYWTKDGE